MPKYRITTDKGTFEVTTEPATHSGTAKVQDGTSFMETLEQDLSAIPGAIKQAVTHPIDTASAILSQSGAELVKAKDQFKAGEYEKSYDSTMRAIPGLGPLVMGARDDIEEGNLGRAGARLFELAAPVAVGRVVHGGQVAADAVAGRLMQSALKPGVADAEKLSDVRAIVKTALDKKISVTEKGIAKAEVLVSELQSKVKKVIADAAAQGKTVDPVKVANRLDDLRRQYANQALPEPDLAIIDKAKHDFLTLHGAKAGTPATPPTPTGLLDASGNPIMRPGKPATPATAPSPIPADKAQAIKVGTYSKTYGDGSYSPTLEAVEKQLGRGFKEELEAIAPEVKSLNLDEGSLLDLLGPLNRRVRAQGNKDLVTGTDVMAGGGGFMAGGPMGAAAGTVAKHTLDSPVFKSRLAILISRAAANSGKPINMTAAMARAGVVLDNMKKKEAEEVEK